MCTSGHSVHYDIMEAANIQMSTCDKRFHTKTRTVPNVDVMSMTQKD